MSVFPPALSFTLTFEDPRHEYAIIPDPTAEDRAAEACAGVNSAEWPDDFATIAAAPQGQRAALVAAFYEKCFWNSWLAQLASQDLANRLFDARVNEGSKTGVELFQQAINAVGQAIEPRPAFTVNLQDWPILVDGSLGPITVSAANKYPEDRLLEAFRAARMAYYEQIAAENPEEADSLSGWLVRARA